MAWRTVALAVLCLASAASLQAQQFRAAWADIFHVGLTSQSDVNTMVSKLVTGRYNAVVVQVLGYMDNSVASHGAHWKSAIVPRSSRVTTGFDPLAYLCQQAHANGIEVHAWLGGSGGAMYRVSTAWPPAGNATLTAHPEWMMVPQANSEGNAVVAINGNYLLDMGSSDAQEYIVSIVRELVTNYPIDGINWDDEHGGTEYSAGLGFPAYSTAAYPRSGLARYRANTGYVGTPSATDATYGNYRRRFKNELIARCQAEIQSIKTNPRQPLRHTASTMAYGGPPSTCTFTSEEAYTYYSDWPTMLQNGWLDAAIPMNYKTSANDSMYRSWCDRAYSCWRFSRHIYVGLGAYLNPMDYTITQMQYAYASGLNGCVTYSYGVPSTDAGDWWSYVAANLYTNTATVPTMPWRYPATATSGVMWGRVKEGRTGLYIDDATVTVASGPAVKTDGNGYYVAAIVSASASGTAHSTTASKAGMVSQTTNAIVLAGDIVRYDFVLKGYTVTALSPISPNPACAGAAVSLTATVTGTNGPTGMVEFFDGAASLGTATLSGGAATKPVASLSVGTHNSITATYLGDGANSPSSSSSRSVTVNAIPSAPTVGNNGPICVGSTLNLAASTVSGATYAWTGPGGFTSTNQNPSIPDATTAASGQYSVMATVNGCASTAGTTTVTVNDVPAAPTAGSDSPRLPGSALHLTASTISGATYAWTGPNGFASSEQNPTINDVTRTNNAGQYSVTATVNGCTSAAGSTSVVVNTPPTAPDTSAATTNQTLVLLVADLLSRAGDADPGDTLSITASGPTSTNGPANNVVLDVSAGTISYTPATNYVGADSFTYTVCDCFGATVTPAVCVTVAGASVPPPTLVIPPTYDSGSGTFRVTFAGVPNGTYTVQWAPSVTGSWSFLKTTTADTNGLFEITDAELPPPPARYYRITCP
jgi:uncharacterized lipoprotein YddW (UPF0748 family)